MVRIQRPQVKPERLKLRLWRSANGLWRGCCIVDALEPSNDVQNNFDFKNYIKN